MFISVSCGGAFRLMNYLVNVSPDEVGHRAFIAYFNEWQILGKQNAICCLDAEVASCLKVNIVAEHSRWLEHVPTEIGMEILHTIVKRICNHDDEELTKNLLNILLQRLNTQLRKDLPLSDQKIILACKNKVSSKLSE